jgi:hypothetical protein
MSSKKTTMLFDIEILNDLDLWTTERIIEELFLDLASVKEKIYNAEGGHVTVHKYYHQAREKMYWIPITKGKGRMSFVIHLSDLTERVKKELQEYYIDAGKKGLSLVLNQAVCRIFENLDFEYTHTNIVKNLAVRLIK